MTPKKYGLLSEGVVYAVARDFVCLWNTDRPYATGYAVILKQIVVGQVSWSIVLQEFFFKNNSWDRQDGRF